MTFRSPTGPASVWGVITSCSSGGGGRLPLPLLLCNLGTDAPHLLLGALSLLGMDWCQV